MKKRTNHNKYARQSQADMFLSKNIKTKMRKTLLKDYFWSVGLYGEGTQTIGKIKLKILFALETRRYKRKFTKINWTEHSTSELVFRRIEETVSFSETS